MSVELVKIFVLVLLNFELFGEKYLNYLPRNGQLFYINCLSVKVRFRNVLSHRTMVKLHKMCLIR